MPRNDSFLSSGRFYTLVGPPGAGKGTQAAGLCAALGIGYLSTGDMMRAAAKAAGPEGDKLREYASSGHLAPDDFTNDMVARRLDGFADGCLFDGYPRTVPQAQALDDALAARDGRLAGAIHLDFPVQLLAGRLTGRRLCPQCGRSYHVRDLPPRREGLCDDDGAQLITRADDITEKVALRLDAYQRQTAPLLDYYAASGRLISADARGSVSEVAQRLLAAIDDAERARIVESRVRQAIRAGIL